MFRINFKSNYIHCAGGQWNSRCQSARALFNLSKIERLLLESGQESHKHLSIYKVTGKWLLSTNILLIILQKVELASFILKYFPTNKLYSDCFLYLLPYWFFHLLADKFTAPHKDD